LPSSSPISDDSNKKTIYTVSELNQDVRCLLENGFPNLWIEGEISNFAAPSSGHWYFSLKDSRAQVRCAMFKNKTRSVNYRPEQGDLVLVKAKISLYEARGEYQLIIDSMEPAGLGKLQREFDALKLKLQKEGLFASAIKKELPSFPQHIAIITSQTGAAIRDILSVLNRRYALLNITVLPVAVQGVESAPQIIRALQQAENANCFDLIILSRGGGSLEDLWSFNEEAVARAIVACPIPIVTGVGHEIDFTIADFVADARAATPSAAAELVVPDQNDILKSLLQREKQLWNLITQLLNQKINEFSKIARRLTHPAQRIRENTQRLDELEMRLFQALINKLQFQFIKLQHVYAKLQQCDPSFQIEKYQQTTEFLLHNLCNKMLWIQQNKQNQLTILAKTLDAYSPLATLNRGYAIVNREETNEILYSIKQVKEKENIRVRLNEGNLYCSVNRIEKS